MNFHQENIEQEHNILRQGLIKIAVETWRIEQVMNRMLQCMDAKEQSRYSSKMRWFLKNTYSTLSDVKMQIVDYTGNTYDSGYPVTPINIDDFSEDDVLYISQMIEPVIVDASGSVVHTGIVSLQKK